MILTTDNSFTACAGAVLGRNIWGPGPSSFGRQQRLSEITVEPINSTSVGMNVSAQSLKMPIGANFLGGRGRGLGKIVGACAPWPNIEPPLCFDAIGWAMGRASGL